MRDTSGTNNPMYKHGMTNSRLFSIWRGMKKRCYQQSSHGYKNYGGRGITVCDEWRNSFIAFMEWAFANGYSEEDKELTIDRIDVNGNYTPTNCRWANRKEQYNNKRNSVIIEYNGEKHALCEWGRILGVPRGTIQARYRKGWDAEHILFGYNNNQNHVNQFK